MNSLYKINPSFRCIMVPIYKDKYFDYGLLGFISGDNVPPLVLLETRVISGNEGEELWVSCKVLYQDKIGWIPSEMRGVPTIVKFGAE